MSERPLLLVAVAAAASMMAGCQVDLDEPFVGRACDETHACGPQTRCEEGVCVVPAEGVLGEWREAGAVTPPRQLAAGAAMGGFIYLAGGCSTGTIGSTCEALSDVHVGRVDDAGEAIAWRATTRLPAPRAGMGMATVGSSVYVVGGNDSSATWGQVWVATKRRSGGSRSW